MATPYRPPLKNIANLPPNDPRVLQARQGIGQYIRDYNASNAQMQPIVAPSRKTLGQAYSDIQSLIPSYTPINFEGVSSINASSVPKLSGINPNQFRDVAYNPTASINPNQFRDVNYTPTASINPNQFGDVRYNQIADINASQFRDINPQSLSNLDANAFGNIQGFDDSYYNNLTEQATKRLQEKYFTNSGSLLDQRSNDLKRRGVFGSGVGESAISDLYRSFGDEMADFQAQIASEKARNDLELAKQNRSFAFDVARSNQDTQKFNIQNLIDAAGQNRNFAYNLASNNQENQRANAEQALKTALENRSFGYNIARDNQENSRENAKQLLETGLANRSFGYDLARNNQENERENAKQLVDTALANRNFSYDLARDNQENEKFNIQNLLDIISKNSDIAKFNAENSTEAQFRNAENRNKLAELGLGAASDEAKTESDFLTRMFEQEVDLRNKDRESQDNSLENLISSLGNTNISSDTRGYLESLLNSQFGHYYGVPFSDYKEQTSK